jgi:hypothetical protein
MFKAHFVKRDGWQCFVVSRHQRTEERMLQANHNRTKSQPTTPRPPRPFLPLVLVALLVGCTNSTALTPTTPSFLFVSPSAALLTTPGEKQEFTVKAFDAQGNEVSIEGLDLEWISSDPSKISITPDPTTSGRITATATGPLGFAVVSVRSRTVLGVSKTTTELYSNAVPAETVRLKPGVETIPDNRIVFPVPDLPPFELAADAVLADITLPDANGNVTIGGFSDREVTALLEASGDPNDPNNLPRMREPLVIRGAPVPAVGTVLVSSGGAGVFSRVIKVETRGEFSLLQLEGVELEDAYLEADSSLELQQLVASGVMTQEASDLIMEQVLSYDEPLPKTKLTKAENEKSCTTSGGKSLEDIGVNVDPNQQIFNPSFSFTNTLGYDFEKRQAKPGELKVKAGYTFILKGTITPRFQASGEVSFECKLPIPGQSKKTRLAGVNSKAVPVVLAAIAKVALYIIKNIRPRLVNQQLVFKGSIKATTGIQFTRNFSVESSGFVEVGMKYDGTSVTPIRNVDFKPPAIKSDFNLTEDLLLKSRIKLESTLSLLYSTDVSLIFKPLQKIEGPIQKVIDALNKGLKDLRKWYDGKLLDLRRQIFKRLPYVGKSIEFLFKQAEAWVNALTVLTTGLTFAKFSFGGEASLIWANAQHVFNEPGRATPSTAETYLPIKLQFVLEQVDKIIEAFGMKPAQPFTPLDAKLFNSVFYRPLAEETVLVDKKNAKSQSPSVSTSPDKEVQIDVIAKYADVPKFVGPETKAEYGLVWFNAKDGLRYMDTIRLEPSGNTSLRGTIKVTQALCDSLKDSKSVDGIGEFLIAGYNTLLFVPTPGFVGAFTLTCQGKDLVTFNANGVLFPDPSGASKAIVGTVPDDTCQLARNIDVSANVRDETAIATKYKDVVFKLDGLEVGQNPGSATSVTVPASGSILRDLKPGSHTFTLEYTPEAEPGSVNKREVKTETFTVKVKKTDGTICGENVIEDLSFVGSIKSASVDISTATAVVFADFKGRVVVKVDGKEVCSQPLIRSSFDFASYLCPSVKVSSFATPDQFQTPKTVTYDLIRDGVDQITNIATATLNLASYKVKSTSFSQDIPINFARIRFTGQVLNEQGQPWSAGTFKSIGSPGTIAGEPPLYGCIPPRAGIFDCYVTDSTNNTYETITIVYPNGKPLQVPVGATIRVGFQNYGGTAFINFTPQPGLTVEQSCTITATLPPSPNKPC